MRYVLSLFLCIWSGVEAVGKPALITDDSLPGNIARGAEVVSDGAPNPHGPQLVTDGNRGSDWWGEKACPVTLTVDLKQVRTFNRIHIFWDYDGKRYYQYFVEVSSDQKKWDRIIDARKINSPALAEGAVHVFPACLARYIRIVITGSYAAYGTAHIREVEIFAPAPVTRAVDLGEILQGRIFLKPAGKEVSSVYRGPVLDTEGKVMGPGQKKERAELKPGWLQVGNVRYWIRMRTPLELRTVPGGRLVRIDERVRRIHLLVSNSSLKQIQITYLGDKKEKISASAGKETFTVSSVNLVCLSWTNPVPDRQVQDIELENGNDLAGVTVELADFEWDGPSELYSEYVRSIRLMESIQADIQWSADRGWKYVEIAGELGESGREFSRGFMAVPDRMIGRYEKLMADLRKEGNTGEKFSGSLSEVKQFKSVPVLELEGLKKQLSVLTEYAGQETQKIIAGMGDPPKEGFGDRSEIHSGRRAGYFLRLAGIYQNEARKTKDAERSLNYARYGLAYSKLARAVWDQRSKPQSWDIPGPGGFTDNSTGECVREKICLNGVWEMATGGAGRPPRDGWKSRRVPHLPDLPDRCVWYRKKLPIPSRWAGGLVQLNFSAVTAYCEVFVNGVYCGNNYFGAAPFVIPINRALRPGENWIHVFVHDSTYTQLLGSVETKRFYDNSSITNHYPLQEFYGKLTGIWQDVFLETIPKINAQIGLIDTSVRKNILTFPVTVEGISGKEEIEVRARILDKNRPVLEIPSRKTKSFPVVFSIPRGNLKLWGIGGQYGDPNLYFLEVTLWRDGRCVDKRVERFGFREFRVQGAKFLLNELPITLQGYPLEYDPWHMPHMANPEYIRRNFRLAREANFNNSRFFTSGYPFFYDIGDELGVLIQPQHYPNDCIKGIDGGIDYDDPAANIIIKEFYEKWIREFGNHPSVVIWSTENEYLSAGVSPNSSKEDRENFSRYIEYWKRIDAAVKDADPQRRPIQHHGCQGILGTKYQAMLEIADFHYPQPGLVDAWRKKNPRMPLFFGEWNCTGGVGFQDTEAWLKSSAASALAMYAFFPTVNTAGQQVHFAPGPATFYVLDPALMGPWPDICKQFGQKAMVKISWPSLSGRGDLPEAMNVYYPHYGYHINWFDSHRPEMTPNILNEAFRKGQQPMPPVPETGPPELLVKVMLHHRPLADTLIRILPLEGQPMAIDGLLTDSNGTAWFWLWMEGSYRVTVSTTNGISGLGEVLLKRMPTGAGPGWGHIQTVELYIPKTP